MTDTKTETLEEFQDADLEQVSAGDAKHKDWVIIQSMSSPLFSASSDDDKTDSFSG